MIISIRSATNDTKRISELADQLHPDLPERLEVLAEKLCLYPIGCMVVEEGGQTVGYGIAHPYLLGQAPVLDQFLGELPADPNCLFVHDIGLLERVRRYGTARRMIERLAALTSRPLALVAVNGTASIWARIGFVQADCQTDLSAYGDAVYMIRRPNA